MLWLLLLRLFIFDSHDLNRNDLHVLRVLRRDHLVLEGDVVHVELLLLDLIVLDVNQVFFDRVF